MNPRDRVAEVTLCVLAFAWALGPYEVLPVVFVPLSAVCGVVLTALVLADVVSGARFRAPFELIWPALLAAALDCAGVSSELAPVAVVAAHLGLKVAAAVLARSDGRETPGGGS